MRISPFKIIEAYYSNYVEPLNRSMYPDGQKQYYPDQEQSYTDLSQLDSQHGGLTFKERYPFCYPDTTDWTNPTWADGDFQSPYKSEFLNYEKFSPNETVNIYDPLKGANIKIFKKIPNGSYKIASMDLNDFFVTSSSTLVHKSKKDLWQMFKDEEGSIYIKRLFDEANILKD